jgi:long-chain fatty acid transport protein
MEKSAGKGVTVSRRVLVSAAVLSIAVIRWGDAAANPADMFGMGTDGRGMGSAMTGALSGANAAYYNPAMLTMLDRPEVSAGWVGAHMMLKLNGADLDTQNHNAVELSIGGPLPGKLKFLGIGLSAYVPGSGFARIYVQAPYDPQFLLYRNLGRFAIYPAVSARIGEYVSLGIGLNVFTTIYGQVRFKVDFGSGQAVHRDYIQGMSLTVAPTAGVAFKWKSLVTAGIAYRGSNQMTVKSLSIDFDAGVMDMPMYLSGALFYTPHELAFGAGYRPIKQLLIAADVTWAMWSRAPDMSIRVDVKPSTLLPEVTSAKVDLGFYDIAIPRLGMEYSPIDPLKLRAGYFWFPTPAPTPVHDTNILDTDRHVITLGIGYRFKDPQNIVEGIGIDGAIQYQIFVPRTVIKESLTDAIGDYEIDGGVVVGGISASITL